MRKKSSKRQHPLSALFDAPDLERMTADVNELLAEPDKEVAHLLFRAALFRQMAAELKRRKAGGGA